MLGVAAAAPALGASEVFTIKQVGPIVVTLPQLTSTTAWFLIAKHDDQLDAFHYRWAQSMVDTKEIQVKQLGF